MDLATLTVQIKTAGAVNVYSLFTNIKRDSNSAKLAITNLQGQFTSLFAKVTGGIGVFQLLKNTLKEAANLQQIRLSFETLLGTQQRASNLIQELRTISSSTGFDFDKVADAARLYLSLGGNAQDATRDLKALAAQAAAMGKGADQIDRVVLALGQIRAKGFLSGEEVRQLANNNVKVWQYLTKVLNVDVGTAMDLARRKAINAEAAVQVILKGLSEEFGPSLERRLKTVPGAFDRLVNNIKTSMAQVGEEFFQVSDSVNVLLAAGDQIDRFGQVITDTIRNLAGLPPKFQNTSAAAQTLTDTVRVLGYLFQVLVAIKVVQWLGSIVELFAVVLRQLTAITAVLAVLGVGVSLGNWAAQLSVVQKTLIEIVYYADRAALAFQNLTGKMSDADYAFGKSVADTARKLSLANVDQMVKEGALNKDPIQATKDLAQSAVDAFNEVLGTLSYQSMQDMFKELFTGGVVEKSIQQINNELKNPKLAIELRGSLVLQKEQLEGEVKRINELMGDLRTTSPTASMLGSMGDAARQMGELEEKIASAKEEGLNTDALVAQWEQFKLSIEETKKAMQSLGDDNTLKNMVGVFKSDKTLEAIVTKAYGNANIDFFISQVESGDITVQDFIERLDSLQKRIVGQDAPFKDLAILNPDAASKEDYARYLENIAKSTQRVAEENEALVTGDPWGPGSREIIKYRAELERLGLSQDKAAVDALKKLEELHQAQNRLRQFRNIADEIGESFTNAFEDIAFSAKSLSDALKDMLQSISQMILRQMVLQPVSNMISNAAMTGMTSFAGFFAPKASGNGLGGGPGSRPITNALGNAFANGRIIPFAMGGVPDLVGGPTLFPMAGGRRGLMGEAGPEAIVPLKRGSDGKLGVAGGGVTNITNLNVQTKDADSFRRGLKSIKRKLRSM